MVASSAVEEALRWSCPVTHFMRRASSDVEMHGEKIKAGDAVTAWIGSANRDEAVFDRPYTLDFRRSPNRHITFLVMDRTAVSAVIWPRICSRNHLSSWQPTSNPLSWRDRLVIYHPTDDYTA